MVSKTEIAIVAAAGAIALGVGAVIGVQAAAGYYIKDFGDVSLIVKPINAPVMLDNTIVILDAVGEYRARLPVGQHTFSFGAVPGYITPQNISLTVEVTQPGVTTIANSRTVTYTVAPPPPPLTVDFNFSPGTAQVNQPVSFTASASGGTPPYMFAWDFGDGTTGTGNQAVHSYTKTGTYTVTLTASDSQGLSSPTTHSITVQGPIITTLSLTSHPNPSLEGQTVTLSGALKRSDTGAGLPMYTVTFQAFTGIAWENIPNVQAVTDGNGNYTTGVVFVGPGTFNLKAQFAGT